MHDGASSPPTTLTRLGRYRVVRRIGKGGMGEVWLCEDPSLHRQVAIKSLPSHSHGDQAYVDRFLREAQAAAALNHPHIVPIHDYGEQPLEGDQSVSYIVMPYIASGSLEECIRRGDNASNDTKQIVIVPEDALAYLWQAAQAIDFAHERGVIHRDIKPANMLLRDDGWLLLADFGIARLLTNVEQRTEVGAIIGTPYYMAPEQAQGKPEFGSDNYSLAVIAYQLFTGVLPFHADSIFSITIQHITQPPIPPRHHNPALPPAFELALLRGLAKKPEDRFPSAQAFVSELQHTFSDISSLPTYTLPLKIQGESGTNTSQVAVRDSSVSGNLLQKQVSSSDPLVAAPTVTRRHMVRWGIGGGVTLLAAGGVGAWYWTTQKPIPKPAPSPKTPPALVLRGHDKPVCSLSWSPTNILASGGESDDEIVCLWDVAKLYDHKLPKPTAKGRFYNGDKFVSWSPKGDMLAIADTGSLASQDFTSTSITIANSHISNYAAGYTGALPVKDTFAIDAIAWAPNNYILTLKVISAGSSDKNILTVWDTQQANHPTKDIALPFSVSTSISTNPPYINPLAVAPSVNPLRLAMSSMFDGVYYYELTFSQIGSSPSLKAYPVLKFAQDPALYAAGSVSWSANGQFIACIQSWTEKPSGINTWDTHHNNQQKILELPPDTNPNTYLTSHIWDGNPSSMKIAGGLTDGTVYIWDFNRLTSPIQKLTPPVGITNAVNALAWSSDGQWLAAAYNDRQATILVWKM